MSDTGKFALPEIGGDWLAGLVDQYVILSLKTSSKEVSMFWMPHGLGYTCSLLNAGRFTRQEVEENMLYYNDGVDAVAVPCTGAALATLGLYEVVADYSMLKIFLIREIADPTFPTVQSCTPN